MVKGHSYCNYEIWNNDGKFNSIGREDETNLMLLTKQVNINYESLEQCYDESLYNNSGIKCDNVCQTNNLWCKSVVTSSCVIGDSHVSWGLYFNIYIILWHILDQVPSILNKYQVSQKRVLPTTYNSSSRLVGFLGYLVLSKGGMGSGICERMILIL